MYVEGPYGESQINLRDIPNKVYIIVTGGIGVTPGMSLFNHMIHQQEEGLITLDKCIFIWSIKEYPLMTKMRINRRLSNIAPLDNDAKYGVTADVELVEDPEAQLLPESFQPQLISAPAIQKCNSKSKVIPASINEVNTPVPPIVNGIKTGNDFTLLPQVFQAGYFLTAVKNEIELESVAVKASQRNYVYYGRPDLVDIFSKATEYCGSRNITEVGVITCGPTNMTNELFQLCKQRHICKGNNMKVNYDIHIEEFDF